MLGLSLVLHLDYCTPMVSISAVLDPLGPSVRERHDVLPLDVTVLVPHPSLAELGVVVGGSHSVLELEGIRLMVLIKIMRSMQEFVRTSLCMKVRPF